MGGNLVIQDTLYICPQNQGWVLFLVMVTNRMTTVNRCGDAGDSCHANSPREMLKSEERSMGTVLGVEDEAILIHSLAHPYPPQRSK